MTTITARRVRPSLDRLTRIVRLHLVNPWTTIGVPWLVLAFIFLINLAIWGLVLGSLGAQDRADAVDGMQYGASTTYLFVYMLVVAVQTITRTFPLALGYGSTRRDFYLGTTLTFVLLSVFYGAAFTVLSYVEQWTGGWGLGGRMFTAIYFGEGEWYQRLFVFVVGLLFFFFVGTVSATVYVRWRVSGLLILAAIVVVLILGAVVAVVHGPGWAAVGSALATGGPVGVAAWLLVPTVLSAVAGYFALRRATPKS